MFAAGQNARKCWGHRGLTSHPRPRSNWALVDHFFRIRVERHSHAYVDTFVEAVLAEREVVACHLVSGDHDFLLEVMVPDMATYESTVLRRPLTLPTLRDIRTSFASRCAATKPMVLCHWVSDQDSRRVSQLMLRTIEMRGY